MPTIQKPVPVFPFFAGKEAYDDDPLGRPKKWVSSPQEYVDEMFEKFRQVLGPDGAAELDVAMALRPSGTPKLAEGAAEKSRLKFDPTAAFNAEQDEAFDSLASNFEYVDIYTGKIMSDGRVLDPDRADHLMEVYRVWLGLPDGVRAVFCDNTMGVEDEGVVHLENVRLEIPHGLTLGGEAIPPLNVRERIFTIANYGFGRAPWRDASWVLEESSCPVGCLCAGQGGDASLPSKHYAAPEEMVRLVKAGVTLYPHPPVWRAVYDAYLAANGG